ncbi:MAG: phosphate/phosphite/phosphonate ABC transporter substrate-binding protein [Gammaproteobacteria bacterium]|nr:phosphate/phosphite/phosphonate ABC transporter substrate-binding protein [Gammaproteobacteria bacterium]
MKQLAINAGIALLVCLSLTQTLFAAEYKIAVRAINGIEAGTKQWQPTIDYLNQAIPEHNFILVPIVKLQDIQASVAVAEVDFVLTNPSSHVEMMELYQTTALATLNNKRGSFSLNKFGSIIFTLADRDDILTLDDLKNKTLIAVSEPAFGGWQTAWLELLKHNINPYNDLKDLKFANGIQSDVVFSVLNGKADAGVVRTDQLERMAEKNEIDLRYFRILNNKHITDFPFFLSTDLYPEWPFSALSHVSNSVTEKVKVALFSITPDTTAAVNGHYNNWLEAEDYQPVKNLMIKLRTGPFTQY